MNDPGDPKLKRNKSSNEPKGPEAQKLKSSNEPNRPIVDTSNRPTAQPSNRPTVQPSNRPKLYRRWVRLSTDNRQPSNNQNQQLEKENNKKGASPNE
jgi:hypothetical protein